MTFIVERVRDFGQEQDFLESSIVRVSSLLLAELGGRHSWVRIKSGKSKIYRRARGAAVGRNLPKNGIELEYDSRLELGVDGERDDSEYYSCSMELQRANFFEKAVAHWAHPSLEYRVTYRLAILSLALAALSVVLAVALSD